MRNRWINCLLGCVVLLLCVSLAFAAEDGKSKGVKKTTTNDYYNWFTINNIFNWYGNNGDGSVNNSTGQSGFEFPKGSGNTAIFEDGVIWGGFHKGRSDPKVGGSAYNQMLQAGVLTGYGTATTDPTADDPTLAKYRVYKVRPDVTPTTPFASVQKAMEDEAALINRYSTMTAQQLFNQYVKDWNEWPANEGTAVYNDVNKNGRYDAATDVPGQPGADQTLYYVANDANATRTTGGYSSPPIGLEMHRTFWGYNLVGALGNTIFSSTLIINKSGAPVDSMFLVQWSDPDLGEAGDDFVGCDVARSLGFVYNGQTYDATYGAAVPSSGYTFFQGPIVPTGNPADSALFRLKYRHGYKNLKMSAFVFFTQGNATFRDPIRGGDPAGDNEWYRLMNGRIAATDGPFINPKTGLAQNFVLDGDPLSGKGWLDGTNGLVMGDRRMALVTGPITLADRDTQELVVATLVGLGADRLSSVAVIRYYSDLGQSAYNSLFNVPRPPPSPKVAVSQLDGEISMSWADSVGSTKIETFNSAGYAFEGYNVYQFNTSTPDIAAANAKKLATYDLENSVTTIFDDVYDPATGYVLNKPVQFGTDSGIKRVYITTQDAIGQKALVNGTTYYFGVTSYGFNGSPTARPTQLESSPEMQTVIPQWEPPGTRYASATGDTLPVVHAGPSDGNVFPTVVNPNLMKKEGATYKIAFQGPAGTGTWNLVRTWNGRIDTVARNVANQNADDLSPIIDGIQWRVIGAPLTFKDFYVSSNATGPLVPPEAATINSDAYGYPHPSTSGTPVGTRQQSAGKLTASKGWTIATGMNSPTMSAEFSQFVSRVTQAGARWPEIIPYDFEIRFTAAGSKAWNAYTDETPLDVPFELWNIGIGTPSNAADDYRMFPYILDVDGNGTFNLLAKAGTDTVDNGGGGATHSVSGGANDPFTDWFYWVKPANTAPGQAGYNAIAAEVAAGTHAYLSTTTTAGIEPLRRMVIVGWNMGAVATGPGSYMMQMPEAGTTFRIISTKPNSTSDSFTITAAPADQSSTVAQADADRVNVFPNPYLGFNPQEVNKYERFVTFTHLPNTATLRIFNLAGVPVRTLQKSDASQFFTWDLKNESGFPVGAGMYIVYIDMPDVGKTKTLKLGIIPEQQYLDKW